MKEILVFYFLIYSKDEQIQNHWGWIWKLRKKLFHRNWDWKGCMDFRSSYWILYIQRSSQKPQKNETSCDIFKCGVCWWRLKVLSNKKLKDAKFSRKYEYHKTCLFRSDDCFVLPRFASSYSSECRKWDCKDNLANVWVCCDIDHLILFLTESRRSKERSSNRSKRYFIS